MKVEVAPPIRTRRAIGKLAQQRLAAKAEKAAAEQPEQSGPPLIFQAMDALPGYTYPTLGPQLVLAGKGYALSREVHVAQKQVVTKIQIGLNKKGLL